MLISPENSTPALSVSQLNRLASQLLTDNFGMLRVCGEVSNCKQAPSGHWYLSLKDPHALVRAVFFRQRALANGFQPRDGQQVEAYASVTLYEARGEFQLVIDRMTLAGQGNLHEKLAALKAKLLQEGLLDASRKRALPRLPHAIGVITSLRAAALHDVLTALARRAPGLPVFIYPASVQGMTAAAELRAALAKALAHAQVEVLIFCRGGGSIEDLWSFNDEALARAVAASPIPVVSGVGHETDFTLMDFVSDQRMPTPTAAAERVSEGWFLLRQQLPVELRRLQQGWRRHLERAMQQIDHLAWRLQSPQKRLQHYQWRLEIVTQQLQAQHRQRFVVAQQHLEGLQQRLQRAGMARLHYGKNLEALKTRLIRAEGLYRAQQVERLRHLQQTLDALGPQQVLNRGYAIVSSAQHKVITQAQTVAVGQMLRVRLAEGELQAQVLPDTPATND